MSRRATIIGSVIALVAVAGLGWLAWDLTHPEPGTATAGGPGGRAPSFFVRGSTSPGAGA